MLVIFLLGAGRGKVKTNGVEKIGAESPTLEKSDLGFPIDAALAAVRLLENSPYTNAGTGSELNQAAQIECDASIVLEPRRRTASVAAVQGVKNPIDICQRLLHQTAKLPSYPCFITGQGAQDYAASQGLKLGSLETPRARHAYEHWSNELALQLQLPATDTIGVIVLSRDQVCACSSSGGPILKAPGRVGPAAVVGAACDASPGKACIASGFGEDMLNFRLCAQALDSDTQLESLAQSMRTQCSLQREPYFGIVRAEVRGDFVYIESCQTTEYMTWGYKNLATGESKILCTAGAGASKGFRLKF